MLDREFLNNINSWILLLVKSFIIVLILSVILFIPAKENKCYKNNLMHINKTDNIIELTSGNRWINTMVSSNNPRVGRIEGVLSCNRCKIYDSEKVEVKDFLDINSEESSFTINANGLQKKYDKPYIYQPSLFHVSRYDIIKLEVSKPSFSSNHKVFSVFDNKYVNVDCSSHKKYYHSLCGHYSPWQGQAVISGKCKNGNIVNIYEKISAPRFFSFDEQTNKRKPIDVCKYDGDFQIDDFQTWLNPFYAIKIRLRIDNNSKQYSNWIYISSLDREYNIETGRESVVFSVNNIIDQTSFKYSKDDKLVLDIGMHNISEYKTIGGAYIYISKTTNTIVNGLRDVNPILISYGENKNQLNENAEPIQIDGEGYIVLPQKMLGKKIFLYVPCDKPKGGLRLIVNNENSELNTDNIYDLKTGFLDYFINPVWQAFSNSLKMFLENNVCKDNKCEDYVYILHVILLISAVLYIITGYIYNSHTVHDGLMFLMKIFFVVFLTSSKFLDIYLIVRDSIFNFINSVFYVLFNVKPDNESIVNLILTPAIKFIDYIPNLFAKSFAYLSNIPLGILLFLIIIFSILALLMTILDVAITIILAYINVEIALVLVPVFSILILFNITDVVFKRLISVFFNSILTIIFVGLSFYLLFDIVLYILIDMCSFTVCMKNLYSMYIITLNWFVPWGYGGPSLEDKIITDLMKSLGLVIMSVISHKYMSFIISNVDSITSSFGSSIGKNISSELFNDAMKAINNPINSISNLNKSIKSKGHTSGVSASVALLRNRVNNFKNKKKINNDLQENQPKDVKNNISTPNDKNTSQDFTIRSNKNIK